MFVRRVAYGIYERSMLKGIAGWPVPRCIALVISDADITDDPAAAKLVDLARWCAGLRVGEIFVYVSVTNNNQVNQQVRIYADPGSTVQAFSFNNPPATSTAGTLNISGHLVNYP